MRFTVPALAAVALLAFPTLISAQKRLQDILERDGVLIGEDAELAAREFALTQLPDSVRRDIETHGGFVDTEHLLDRDIDGQAILRRDAVKFVGGGPAHDSQANWVDGHGPGVGNCKDSMWGFTFDDGPWQDHRAITDTFRNAGQHLTYFVNGNNYGCIYDEPHASNLQYSMDRGAHIQSHTWGHANLTAFLTPKQIDNQIQLLEEALWKITGCIPRYLRPPYGETNITLNNYLKNRWGLTIVQWKADIGDASGFTPAQSLQVVKNVPFDQPALFLAHETHHETASEVVPKVIARAKKNNKKLNTVHKCLKKTGSPYKACGARQKRDASWTCNGKLNPGDPGPA